MHQRNPPDNAARMLRRIRPAALHNTAGTSQYCSQLPHPLSSPATFAPATKPRTVRTHPIPHPLPNICDPRQVIRQPLAPIQPKTHVRARIPTRQHYMAEFDLVAFLRGLEVRLVGDGNRKIEPADGLVEVGGLGWSWLGRRC